MGDISKYESGKQLRFPSRLFYRCGSGLLIRLPFGGGGTKCLRPRERSKKKVEKGLNSKVQAVSVVNRCASCIKDAGAVMMFARNP